MQGHENRNEKWGSNNSKNSDFDSEFDASNPALNNQLAEALASYFERKNSGENVDAIAFVRSYPAIQGELGYALKVLQLPQQGEQPNVKMAWQRFKGEVFTDAVSVAKVVTAVPSSLGSYVAQALVQNDRELKESGLPYTTLAALTADATPLTEFQNYKFDDYAQLAKRYDVKNELFPRVLKWFKSLSKSLSLNNSNGNFGKAGAGMVFAREEGRNRELSESELSDALEQQPKPED